MAVSHVHHHQPKPETRNSEATPASVRSPEGGRLHSLRHGLPAGGRPWSVAQLLDMIGVVSEH